MVASAPSDPRAKLIRIFTFLGGIYFFLYFVLPESAVTAIGMKEYNQRISDGFIAIGSMAFGLGLFNLIRAHGARCVFQRPGWGNSASLLLGMIAMLTAGTAQWALNLQSSAHVRQVQVLGEFAERIVTDLQSPPRDRQIPPAKERISALLGFGEEQLTAVEREVVGGIGDGALATGNVLVTELREKAEVVRRDLQVVATLSGDAPQDETTATLTRLSQDVAKLASTYSIIIRQRDTHRLSHRVYGFLFDGLFNQLGSAMFALLGVYIAAAAYRAFRVRTVESALMMIAALVVMLGQISFGKAIYAQMPEMRQWLLEVPNSAAFRAIRLGAGVAGLMLAIRMWLSIESTSFRSGEKR